MESNEKQMKLEQYKKILYNQKMSRIKLLEQTPKIWNKLMSTTWLIKS